MKNPVRIGLIALSLGLLGLTGGCASQSTGYGARVRQARDFEVVETSTKRTLSPREMEHLRTKVIDYLARQGVTETGDYYLKVHLGAEDGGAEGEWVVVRYTLQPAGRVELLASYPGGYYGNRSTYAYDYYPFSPFGFSRFSFQYYDYPYYGYGYYPPFRPHRPGHGHHGNHRPDRDDDPKPPRDHARPSGALKPSFVPANVARTREHESPLGRPQDYDFRRRGDSRQRGRYQETGSLAPMNVIPGVNYTRPNTPRRYPSTGSTIGTPRAVAPGTPPSDGNRQRYSRPTGIAPAPGDTGARERRYAPARTDSGRTGREGRTDSSPRSSPASSFKPSAPRAEPSTTYSAPAARSESRAESRSESDSSSSSRTNVNDGGRRAREP